MKNFFRLTILALATVVFTSTSYADVVDHLDFSTAGQGVVHNTTDTLITSGPAAGGAIPNNWVLNYSASNISSDATLNRFVTSGGAMVVDDWGGLGTVEGSWVATSDGTMDIVGVAVTLGNDAFDGTVNNGPGITLPEGITWFYSINGGANVEVFLGDADLPGAKLAGSDISNTFGGVSVTAGDTIDYGFSVAVETAGTAGAVISSVEVDFTAVPEPTSTTILAIGLIGLVARRRR